MSDTEHEAVLLKRLESEEMTVEETMDVLAQYFGEPHATIKIDPETGAKSLVLSDELAERIRKAAQDYDEGGEGDV